MKRYYIHIILFMFLIQLYGCITEYKHTGIQSVTDIFVVEGTITNDTTLIKLSKTIALNNYFMGDEYISNANVSVESDKGEYFSGKHMQKGEYLIETGTLSPGTQYRLKINWEGEEYESTYLDPLFTPEIDSISVIKEAQKAPVGFFVSTHDPLNQSRYFRWRFKEDWEIHSDLIATIGYEIIDGESTLVAYDFGSANNKYYCWGVDSSKVLILESTEKLTENKILLKKLFEMEPSDEKLSYLYYIKVSQEMLRKEAFDYFSNLQKNLDATGGIFSQMPSEVRGNIICTTNPEKTVIGYIEVTTTTTLGRFVPFDEVYERPYNNCSNEITDDPTAGLPVFTSDGMDWLYAPPRCIDCRAKPKASKNRPDFWPNNHL